MSESQSEPWELERRLREVHEREARYCSFVEDVNDWVWEIDRNGRYTYVSPRVRDLTGYEPDEVLGKTFADLMKPDEARRVSEVVGPVFAAHQPIELFENSLVRKDGSTVIVETSGKPVFGADGDFRGYRGIDRDITDRKRVETELRESRRMLQLVLDSIPARVFWKDRDSVFLGCNRLFALDGGVESPDEIIGLNDFDLGWRDQAELYRADDRAVIESGVPKLNYEEPQTAPDGRTIWLRTSKVPLKDAEGGIIGVMGTYEDITPHKEAEKALAQSEANLHALIESTQDLIWSVDSHDYKILVFNSALSDYIEQQFGRRIRPGCALHEAFPPELAALWREIYTRAVREGSYQMEYEKAGGTGFLDLHVNPVRRDGEITAVAVFGEDITERKRLEAEKRRFYRETILSATDGKLSICDKGDVEPYVSDAQVSADLSHSAEVGSARRDVENYLRARGLDGSRLDDFMICVNEAVANAIKHSGDGCVYAGCRDDAVYVGISDNGPGIESLILPKAVLKRGFSTKPSMGLGYSIMLQIADQILLDTGDDGTIVVLIKQVTPEPEVSLDSLPDTWAGVPDVVP